MELQTFQARFVTKQKEYSVEDAVINLNTSLSPEQLNQILKDIIKSSTAPNDEIDDAALEKLKFEFLLDGQLLRQTIDKHEFESEEILSEKIVHIEYFLASKPPRPLCYATYDDWVSCVTASDEYLITGHYDNIVRVSPLAEVKKCSRKQKAKCIPLDSAQISLGVHTLPIKAVQFITEDRNDGDDATTLISCSHDTFSVVTKLWKKSQKTQTIARLCGHTRSVNCVDTLGPERIATGSYDQTLRLWSLYEQSPSDEDEEENVTSARKSGSIKELKAVSTLTGHKESITGIKWINDKTIATCSMDNTIRIWDMEDGNSTQHFISSRPMLGLDYCPELQLILTASCDRHVRLWDLRSSNKANSALSTTKAAYTSHAAWTSCVSFSKDPKYENIFVSGGYDNVVKKWDIRCLSAPLYDLIGHQNRVLCLDWSNSEYIFSGSADNTARVFAN